MRVVLTFLLILLGCTKRNPQVCCETPEECAAVNTREVVACSVGVCVSNECVDVGACDGNEDCELPASCLDGACSSPPPPPDAALKPAFDVAYPNVWRFNVLGQAFPLNLIVVNTDVSPLSMSTLQVKSLSDDHPIAFVRFVALPNSSDIPPGNAGGKAFPNATPLLFGAGLVPEPRTDTESSYVEFEIVDAPTGTYDILADAVLALDGIEFPIRLTIHMEEFVDEVHADPEDSLRASVFKN